MAFPLTEEQRAVVEDRGGELLVSAAAGSGKTRVLVERLLSRVERGADIDRFLVITYTRAAAAELRARVSQELAERLAGDPGNRHLRRQTALVYQAQISTIHALCAALLRESGHLLDLDPDFRLCDEGEAQVLMVQTLETLLDERYEGLEPDGPFAQLTDTLAAGRDDSRLLQIVLDVYGRVQSHPRPEAWLNGQKKLWSLEGVSDLKDTPWGASLWADARRQAGWCRERLGRAAALAEGDELLRANYGPTLAASLDALDAFLRAGTWDEAAARLPIPFPRAGAKRKRSAEISALEEERAALDGERLKALRERCRKTMDKVAEAMPDGSAALLEELSLSRPAVQGLMDLVLDFQAAYAAEKRRRGLLDFSDLEHFAAGLLLDGRGDPTPLAESFSGRFDEVMVDEYQDANQVQNAIFTAVSHRGRTLFQVGDVKQSIYRFRLADPTLFLDKYRRYPDGDAAGEGEPRRRVLTRNFRSRPEVLEGCNDLFRSIMSAGFGELDYTPDQALVPGADFPPGEGYALELDALDLSFLGEEEGEKDDKDLLEARFAARRIAELLRKPLMLREGEGLRPVRPSDVMILLRSPGSVLRHYLRALEEEGVPWCAGGGEDFFQTTEVNVALAILRVVDNPRQDVPLIAALRSPVYDFSGDELALLRTRARGSFYNTLLRAAEEGDRKVQSFLDELSQLRFGAGDQTCRQLIWHIYERTNLLGVFGAMEGGGERRDNLLALYALAGQLEDAGCRSLFQFLLRLDRLRETGAALPAAAPGREGEGVSVLSIHRSKGLEKPVVLVCGLNRRLNRDDLKRPVLFHPELGVGPRGLDRERMVEYQTAARRAVARRLERELMAEELRLLYVAMTRAREKLILTLALPGGVRALERLGEDLSVPPSPQALESQQSVGAWVLLHALTRPEAAPLRALAGLPDIEAEGLGPAWDLRWVAGPPLAERHESEARPAGVPEEDAPGQAGGLSEKLLWRYPWTDSVDVPSKLTATQIKGRELDREAAEESGTEDESRRVRPICRPDFVAERRGLTPAQRGTAIHQAMQYVPLEGDHSPEAVRAVLDGLVEKGFLTRLQGEAVDPERIAAFFDSPLGRALCGARNVRREFKFSLLVPAGDYYPQAGAGEEILLQGVVDAWFEEEDGLTVIDFKSDRVSPGGEAARAESYRPQLEAYSGALEAIFGKKVARKALWFFETDTAVEL